jgi:hypothetical protein
VRPETTTDDLARRRDKYKKRGWSDAKIDRALQAHAADRTESPYVGRFIDAVAGLVREQSPAWLLVQWSPERNDQPTPGGGTIVLSVDEFRALQGEYPEDRVMKIEDGGITTR